MIARETTICNKLGLHARAASKLVGVAQEFGATLHVINGDTRANGKSIMSILMLQAGIGTKLTIEASGDDETAAIDAIVNLIQNRFGEDE